MLKSKAKWIQNTKNINDYEVLHSIPIINQLLIERGIETEQEKEAFLKPNVTQLHSPNLFSQMKEVGTRIEQAIERQEKIMIYGDYDADGVTSTTVLYKALIERNAIVDFYIPNRFKEGYGLNKLALDEIKATGYKLIITVDNGISSINEAKHAKEIGLDLIITDHHEMQKELPDAFAILHPKLSPDYPFKELAGVGVAFKLAEVILGYFPKHLLQFVAIGTISDMVPLIDENRILTYHGLKELSQKSNHGLKALFELAQITDEITEEHVGFQIGPRLNAVGRLQSAHLAVELLLCETNEEAVQISEQVEELNKKRQKIVNDIVKEAEVRVDKKSGVIILYDESWHEGVLGIAASRLVNIYDRPVILLNYNKKLGVLKGSARSIPAFNLFENCMQIRELFNQFGGHSQAAGMTFDFDQLEIIQSQLNTMIFQQLRPEDFRSTIEIAQLIPLNDLTEELVTTLNQLSPFGMNNPKPIFQIKGKPTQIRQIGSEKNHLKIQYKSEDKLIDVIAFRLGYLYNYISNQAVLEVVGQLSINEWNGNRTVQIIAEDMAVNEQQLFDYRGKKSRTNLKPYIDQYGLIVAVQSTQTNLNVEGINYVNYKELGNIPNEIDLLILSDMPNEINDLLAILEKVKTDTILINYDLFTDKLAHLPSRDDFKKLYNHVNNADTIDMKKNIPLFIQKYKWTRQQIIFMVLVFKELNIFNTENGVVSIGNPTSKKDLSEAEAYQLEVNKENIENKLYYSSYEELKTYLFKNMDN